MIVGLERGSGKLGECVTDYLVDNLKGRVLFEIDPADYFLLGGVTVEDDLVQFPETTFYICPDYNLVILKSAPPAFELFKFFNHIIDVAEHTCKTRAIYSIGGLVSLVVHTLPRKLLGTVGSYEIKEDLRSYDVDCSSSFETSPGQKPTLNSFLLWTTRKRNLSGIDLWIPIPFYLMSLPDIKSQKTILDFFNQRFKFGMDLREFDEKIIRQNRKINEVRNFSLKSMSTC
jgi:proteasome assembly chaperone (PAC2) family protein